MSCRFNWLWYDVTTYAPYEAETSYEGSLLLTGAGAGVSARGAALALSGLIHVARSLTSNARGVFRILAEREIEGKESTENEKIEGMLSDIHVVIPLLIEFFYSSLFLSKQCSNEQFFLLRKHKRLRLHQIKD